MTNEETRQRSYKRRLVSLADDVVAVSEHSAKTAKRQFNVTPEVIYNGIDTDYFRPERSEPALFDELGIEPPIFLFVGSFEKRKRPTDILDVARTIPEATFLLRGSGPLGETVQTVAADIDNVRLLNRLKKSTLARIYANVAGLIFPSIREGCRTVVLEALASGTPVVGYEATSMPELVNDGKTGYLCDVGATDALADAVSVISDPDRNQRMGACAREYAYNHHRFEKIAERYRDLYARGSTELATGSIR